MNNLKRIKVIADDIRSFSTCEKHQVGAVIFNEEGKVLATGCNGAIKCMPMCAELFRVSRHQAYYINYRVQDLIQFEFIDKAEDLWCLVTRDEWDRVHRIFAHKYEVHAEQNAIYNLLKSGCTDEKLYLYTTLEPCDQCAKAICAMGFNAVYVGEHHKACHILADKTIYMEDINE